MSMLDTIDDNTEVIAFKPDTAGEGVEGVVLSRDITSSEYTTDDIPVILLTTDEGVVRSVRGYHSVLRNEINRADPKTGDRIAVKYLGKKPTKDGKKSFHAYKVAVKRADMLSGMRDATDDAPF